MISCNHGPKLRSNRAPANRRDPTRTATLRAEYVRGMRKRFGGLRKLITETVVENDALGLADEPPLTLPVLLRGHARAAKRYDFPSDPAGKAQAFLDWLQEAVDADLLDVTYQGGRRVVASTHWQNVYVRGAYARGVDQATAGLRKAGLEIPDYSLATVFNTRMHADALGLLYARNFNDLKGITDAMSQQIGRVLAEGLASGVGPREVARLINGRVNAIGLSRANTLARTEIIRAHAEATLNRYEEFGIDEVEGFAEWATAGDALVCPLCLELDGQVFKLSEARGMLPRHPNCRCAWKPVIRLVGNRLWIINITDKLHYVN